MTSEVIMKDKQYAFEVICELMKKQAKELEINREKLLFSQFTNMAVCCNDKLEVWITLSNKI